MKLKSLLKNDKHLSELIKGSGAAILFKVLGILSSYMFTFLLARLYGAETLGVFTVTFIILQIVSTVVVLGLDTSLMKILAEKNFSIFKKFYSYSISFILILSLFFSIFLYLFSSSLSEIFFKSSEFEIYIKWISFVIFPFSALLFHTEGLRGLKKIKEYVFFQQAGIFLLASIFIGICFFLCKISTVPILSFVVSVVLISLFAFIIFFKDIKNRFSTYQNTENKDFSSIWKFSVSIFFSNILIMLMSWMDVLLLSIFATPEDLGIFSVAQKVSLLINIPLIAVNSIAAPKFAEIWYKGDMNLFRDVVDKSTKIIFFISFPILIFVALLSKQILSVFGVEFVSGLYVLLILLLKEFFNSISGSVGYILKMTNNQNVLLFNVFFSLVVKLILALILIPAYKALGAAISIFVGGFILNLMCVLYLKYKYNLVTFYIPFLRIFEK